MSALIVVKSKATTDFLKIVLNNMMTIFVTLARQRKAIDVINYYKVKTVLLNHLPSADLRDLHVDYDT